MLNKVMQENIESMEGSFIYFFHEENEFNEKKYFEFIESICVDMKFLSDEERFSLINIFLYVLKSFIYHFDESDSSEILNFLEIKERMVCYVELAEYVILCLSIKSEASFSYVEKIIFEYSNVK
jgi:flagellar biosynthesis regulator FlaF